MASDESSGVLYLAQYTGQHKRREEPRVQLGCAADKHIKPDQDLGAVFHRAREAPAGQSEPLLAFLAGFQGNRVHA